jgi:hypothetical protein
MMMAGISLSEYWFIPISMYLFEFTFTLSVGGVLYVYIVEILPSELVPISSVICWISKVVISWFTLDFINAYGIYSLFFVFFICCLIGFLILFYLAVESKDKKGKQIFNEFQQKLK